MKKVLISIMLLLIVNFFIPTFLFAEPTEESYSMPVESMFSGAEIAQSFKIMQGNPFNDPNLAYKIIVPKEWTSPDIEVEAKESFEKLIPIGMFTLAGASQALIEVSYLRLQNEMTTDSFLRSYCYYYGMKVLKVLQVEYASREATDMLVERQGPQGQRLVSRLSASKHGSHLFVISCSVLSEEYGSFYKIFALACVSFELANPKR